MIVQQQVQWTVLPGGLTADGTEARISVFVAPRLGVPDSDPAPGIQDQAERGTLEPFGDFLSWPLKVAAATFEFGPGDGVSPAFAGPLPPTGPAPDNALWQSLFNADTPLQPYVFEGMVRPSESVHTYPARLVSEATRKAYADAARQSPEDPPAMGSVMQRVLGPRTLAAVGGGSEQGAAMRGALDQLGDFHKPASATPRTLTGEAPPPPPPPERPHPDFHQMLTSLGDHPALLRRLGLILDFLVPLERLPASSGERFLSVIPHWASELGENSRDLPPRTRYVLLPERKMFVAGPRDFAADPLASPARGLVALPEEKFSLEQADVDAAALKLLTQPEDGTGLSPVRTQGLSLVRDGRKDVLDADFTKAAAANSEAVEAMKEQSADRPDSQKMPSLDAEDLVRGHRMDIWDSTRERWFSLHERTVEYQSPNGAAPFLTAADEGFFQVNLVSPPDDPGGQELFVPETIITWDGWSHSAPRPGRVLGIADEAPDQVIEPTSRAEADLPLEIAVKVRKGSLPRLRFGHGYRIRLRTVDLAGNGLTLDEADALTDPQSGNEFTLPGDGPVVFQRFEAAPPPALLPRLPLGEGASVNRLVIRSSPGSRPGPAGAPGAGTRVVTLANVQVGSTHDDVRVVQQALIDANHAIPKGPTGFFGDQTRAAYAAEQRDQGFRGQDADGVPGCQSLTELGRRSGFAVDCGGAEAALLPGQEPARSAEQYAAEFNSSPLVTDEGHAPYSGVDERHLVAPKASLQCVERHALLDGAIGSQDHAAREAGYALASRESGSLNDPAQPGVEVEPVKSPSADPDHPVTTARHTGEQVELPYLPDPLVSGAVLLDLPGMEQGRPFEVPWGGDVWHRPRSFRLRLAEGAAPPRFDEASRVLTVSLPKARTATVRVCSAIHFDEKLMGLASWCWELPEPSPQQPPEEESRQAEERRRADAAMELAAGGRHWMFTPWQELTLVHAVQRPLKQPVLNLTEPTADRAAGATAEHLTGTVTLEESSTGRVELVAEWNDVVDQGETGRLELPRIAPVFDLLTARVPAGSVPGDGPAALKDGILAFSTEAAENLARTDPVRHPPTPEKHEFGDTKHRRVRYRPVAGTKFGDHFPARLAETDPTALTVEGTAVEYSVLSSAPPAAPRLLYCMPTLSFESLDGPPGTVVRLRRGGGIRVFMDRTWFSSGDGELLGVVVGQAPGGTTAADPPWVTVMGRDPIHRSAEVVAPTVSTFTNAVRQDDTLSVPTPAGPLPVTVMGFSPQLDPDGDRWFCDLEMDTGDTFLPFIRLALVRYQPDSIRGAEISAVVRTDLLRILPDRELRVQLDDPPTVSVTGPSYDPTDSTPPRITAVVQRRREGVADDDLAWVTLDDTGVELTSVDADSSHRAFYTGQVPMAPDEDRARLRLLILETDGMPSDAATPPTTPGPVVYCDTVPLGPGGGPDHDHIHDERRDRRRFDHDDRHDDQRHGPRHR
ncbi:peptidoglycan-binding domain-containing protein [Streptomyces sp. NPDC006458]|uniref:peptidoglycan-binding domain-containing protein n=1 Tax=Streptomyces sp. NPDC006458 TaxID=3154302 RepID=UPI0033AE6B49